MKTGTRIIKNSIFLLSARVLALFLSFFLVLAVARLLGVEGFGVYSLVISLLIIFQTISSMGIPLSVPREVAKHKEQVGKYFFNVSLAALVIAACIAGAMILTGRILRYGSEITSCLNVLSLYLFPSAIIMVAEGIFLALEKVKMITFSNVFEHGLKLILSLLVLFLGKGILALIVVLVLVRFLTLFFNLYLLRQTIPFPRLEIDLTFCYGFLRLSITFALLYILVNIFFKIDVVILSKLRGTVDVGIYSAAYKLWEVFFLVPATVSTVVFPLLSQRFQTSREDFTRLIRKTISYLSLLVYPATVVICFLSKDIIYLLYESQFSASVVILQVVIWTMVPYVIDVILGSAILASGNQKYDVVFVGVGMLSNIGLNFVLIPPYGPLGAAVATLITMFLILGLHYHFVSRRLFKLNLFGILWRPTVIAGALCLFLFFLRGHSPILLLVLSCPLYVFLLFATGAVSREELSYLQGIWRGRNPGTEVLGESTD